MDKLNVEMKKLCIVEINKLNLKGGMFFKRRLPPFFEKLN